MRDLFAGEGITFVAGNCDLHLHADFGSSYRAARRGSGEARAVAGPDFRRWLIQLRWLRRLVGDCSRRRS